MHVHMLSAPLPCPAVLVQAEGERRGVLHVPPWAGAYRWVVPVCVGAMGGGGILTSSKKGAGALLLRSYKTISRSLQSCAHRAAQFCPLNFVIGHAIGAMIHWPAWR
jgi:hypothetical protein